MADEQQGDHITATIKEITKAYDLAKPKEGLLSVKFVNPAKGYKGINEQSVDHLMKDRTSWARGTTQIGSALQNKVINNFVFNKRKKMERPLLVMIITDGEVSSINSEIYTNEGANFPCSLREG